MAFCKLQRGMYQADVVAALSVSLRARLQVLQAEATAAVQACHPVGPSCQDD